MTSRGGVPGSTALAVSLAVGSRGPSHALPTFTRYECSLLSSTVWTSMRDLDIVSIGKGERDEPRAPQ